MKEKTRWCIFLLLSFVLTIAGGIGCGVGAAALFKGVPAEDLVFNIVHIAVGGFVALFGIGFVIAFITLIMLLVDIIRGASMEDDYAESN